MSDDVEKCAWCRSEPTVKLNIGPIVFPACSVDCPGLIQRCVRLEHWNDLQRRILQRRRKDVLGGIAIAIRGRIGAECFFPSFDFGKVSSVKFEDLPTGSIESEIDIYLKGDK